ncbi:MAG: PrsW family glutamic-type intramembrane protease [Verrucomicrobiota bacterium]
MSSRRNQIASLTRSKPFLIRGFLGICAFFLSTAVVVSFFRESLLGLVRSADPDKPTVIVFHYIVAILVGLIWFLIMAKMSGLSRWKSVSLLIGIAGIVLGWCSAMVTGMVIEWHEEIAGIALNGDLANDLIYWISSVGVREETLKLLFCLPLALVIARWRSRWEMVLAAACVGLGFAIEENLNYYYLGGGSAMIIRLLSSNFVHMAWTGIAGFALFQWIRRPTKNWDEFLIAYIFVVVTHGLHNLLLTSAVPADFAIFQIILFVIIAYRFFALIKAHRNPSFHEVSPLAVFIFGTGIIIGLALNYSVILMPWRMAVSSCGMAAMSFAVIGYLYIREMRDD